MSDSTRNSMRDFLLSFLTPQNKLEEKPGGNPTQLLFESKGPPTFLSRAELNQDPPPAPYFQYLAIRADTAATPQVTLEYQARIAAEGFGGQWMHNHTFGPIRLTPVGNRTSRPLTEGFGGTWMHAPAAEQGFGGTWIPAPALGQQPLNEPNHWEIDPSDKGKVPPGHTRPINTVEELREWVCTLRFPLDSAVQYPHDTSAQVWWQCSE